MCNYVEGVFVGFVEHVPVDQNREAELCVNATNVTQLKKKIQTYGPRLMCFTFTLVLPIDAISESG